MHRAGSAHAVLRTALFCDTPLSPFVCSGYCAGGDAVDCRLCGTRARGGMCRGRTRGCASTLCPRPSCASSSTRLEVRASAPARVQLYDVICLLCPAMQSTQLFALGTARLARVACTEPCLCGRRPVQRTRERQHRHEHARAACGRHGCIPARARALRPRDGAQRVAARYVRGRRRRRRRGGARAGDAARGARGARVRLRRVQVARGAAAGPARSRLARRGMLLRFMVSSSEPGCVCAGIGAPRVGCPMCQGRLSVLCRGCSNTCVNAPAPIAFAWKI